MYKMFHRFGAVTRLSGEEKPFTGFWKGFGIGVVMTLFFSITTFALGFYANP